MRKKRKQTEEPTQAQQAAQQLPVVKPRGGTATGTGRSTLEDRVGVAVRPKMATSTTARSTYRDLRPV